MYGCLLVCVLQPLSTHSGPETVRAYRTPPPGWFRQSARQLLLLLLPVLSETTDNLSHGKRPVNQHDNKNVCTGEGEELPESHQLSNADGQDCLTTPAYPCSLLSHCGHLHAAETTEMMWEASRKTCFHCKAEAGLIGVSHTEMGHLHPYILYALIQAADTIDTILTEVYWLWILSRHNRHIKSRNIGAYAQLVGCQIYSYKNGL